MKKTICIYLIIAVSVAGCKTAKNYVVSKESYEVINVLGKNLGKRKEDQLFYKTYGGKIPTAYGGEDWGTFVSFERFNGPFSFRVREYEKTDFQDYVTENDIQHMREQITNQTSVKW